MPQVIQQVYRQHLDEGWPGIIARPNVPYKFTMHKVSVPAGSRKPRPGDALVFNATDSTVHTPDDAAAVNDVFGVCAYDTGVVTSTLDSTPSGANSNAYVEYDAGEFALVCTFGVIYATAGTAAKFGDRLQFNRTDNDWDVDNAATALATDAISTGLDTATNVTQTSLTAAAKAAIDTEVNTKVDAALAALKAQVAAYIGDQTSITITCDNTTGVTAGGLVMLNIGVRG